MGENKARASDSVTHPHSPTGKALIDADNVPSFIALSLRASGGVCGPKAALIVSHIPMTEPYIGVLRKSLWREGQFFSFKIFRLRECAVRSTISADGAATSGQLLWRGSAIG
jgi:hypothetical protein